MKYGSVCSGIEAASVAWHGLGWEPQWFSEIEKFPCEVLKERFPETPNLGDMTKLTYNDTFKNTDIDLLVGGTPCQSFSVAGLRAGLDDERGNLALEFVRLLMRKQPRWFLWENVPGVLSSSNGADFAAILSAWTGRDIEPQKFTTAGVIQGDFYSVAWRVLDSQHFGVAQRRRRVFVVGHLGNDWRPSAAVLFESESLRGNTTPRRKKRESPAGDTEGSINCQSNGITGTVTSKWAKGTGGPAGDEHYNLIVQPYTFDTSNTTSPTNRSNPQPGDPCHTLTKFADTPTVVQPIVLDDRGGSVMNVSDSGIVDTLRKETHGHEPILCFKEHAVCEGCGKGYLGQEDKTFTLSTRQDQSIMHPAYGIQANIIDRSEKSGGDGLGVKEEEAPTLTKSDRHAVCQPIVWGFDSLSSNSMKSKNPNSGVHIDDVVKTLDTGYNCPSKNQGGNAVQHAHVIRRLTPMECERLQGFPDGWTDIPGATDSKRYAALGNSMTVNVMRWIGKRIDDVDFITHVIGF